MRWIAFIVFIFSVDLFCFMNALGNIFPYFNSVSQVTEDLINLC